MLAYMLIAYCLLPLFVHMPMPWVGPAPGIKGQGLGGRAPAPPWATTTAVGPGERGGDKLGRGRTQRLDKAATDETESPKDKTKLNISDENKNNG